MRDTVWIKTHALLMLVGMGGLTLSCPIWLVIVLAMISVTLYLGTNLNRLRQIAPFGGYANGVTLARLALLLVAAGNYVNWHNYLLFVAFLAVIVSDGVDGYLARRYDQTSPLGGTLDIETDALMSALLASVHYLQGTAAAWVLLAGALRYLYVWGVCIGGLENVPAPKQAYARLIGVLFICSLMGPFVAPHWLAYPVLILGCSLVTLSFGLSFYNRWQATIRR